jgi:hypothetical protein
VKHTNKRLCKIVDELFTYFLNIGANDITFNFKDNDDHYELNLVCNYKFMDKKKLDKLIKYLNYPKSEAMEEYYWELAGESDVDTELTIVGMMTDDKTIEVNEDTIEIKLKRYKCH